jgi:Cu-processing system permease protein
MKSMNYSRLRFIEIANITFKGGLRDRVFITMIAVSLISFILIVPSISSMSMRQVKEVSVGLSLSIISLVCLVLTIFLGVNLVFRDIERRFAYFTLSLPVRRNEYILGKFTGLCMIIGLAYLILSLSSLVGIVISSKLARQGLILWENFIAAIFLDFLSNLIIASIATLFSAFSTNVFLPLFSSLGFYIAGNAIQTVSEYIKSSYGERLPAFSVFISKIAYYIFPNLTALDIKFNAIYGIPLSFRYLLSVSGYAIIYIVIVMVITLLSFRKRQL